MKKNDWMTEFYGKEWLELDSSELKIIRQNSLLEFRASAQDVENIVKAEKAGFNLVESAIEFETEIEPTKEVFKEIELAKNEDLDEILSITKTCFVDNEALNTRFKNREFFTRNQCEEYYSLSVRNNFFNSDSICVVSRDLEGISAYYMMKKRSEGCYKGVMTGVSPRARGKRLHLKMQLTCFNRVKESFTMVNSTQLSNFNTIRSHIRGKRTLSKIEHIFFKLT